MKFWKCLGWIFTLAFVLMLAVIWLANDHHATATPELQNDPPPAPTFR